MVKVYFEDKSHYGNDVCGIRLIDGGAQNDLMYAGPEKKLGVIDYLYKALGLVWSYGEPVTFCTTAKSTLRILNSVIGWDDFGYPVSKYDSQELRDRHERFTSIPSNYAEYNLKGIKRLGRLMSQFVKGFDLVKCRHRDSEYQKLDRFLKIKGNPLPMTKEFKLSKGHYRIRPDIRINRYIWAKFDRLAKVHGTTTQTLVDRYIRRFVERYKE